MVHEIHHLQQSLGGHSPHNCMAFTVLACIHQLQHKILLQSVIDPHEIWMPVHD